MVAEPPVLDVARRTLDRARDHLLGLQHPGGWWQGELETNVTMDAEDLLLRQFLGVRDDAATAAAARWIRSRQRADGSWANFFGGPGDLSTTVEAYLALRLAGDVPEAPHMIRARDWILAGGGVEATRVFTRIWLALSGLWSWDDLPVIPPELIWLPSWFPLNIYDWGCWARQTIVALAVVQSFRPSRPLPFGIDELKAGTAPARPPADPWARAFAALDRVLHALDPGPAVPGGGLAASGPGSGPGPGPGPGGGLAAAAPGSGAAVPGPLLLYRSVKARMPGTGRPVRRAVRRAALRRCAEWIIARQERDGCWGGIQPPWVYSLMALNLLGYDLGHPVMARGLAGLDRFTIAEDTPEGPVRRLEACQSPVWDTVLAMTALADAGLPPDHPALVKAGRWVLGEEIRGPGDWQVRRPDLAPGGWAFEFDNDNYPDTDDTAEVILALRRVSLPATEAKPAIERGLRWLAGMQSRDGGWGAFDADNTRELVTKLPFCDFGAVIDPPSADVTAHILEAFAAEGLAGSLPARRGGTWLLRAQQPDGSWFGRWGANYIYGTGAAVPALVAAGVRPSKPAIRRAVAWLEARQNDDGGWGEDLRSYDDPALAGRGASTASQTAWALLALLAAGERHGAAAERGVRWLAAAQRDDGSWDEPAYTGTGFPGDFYINYHLYRLAFPVSALGRFVHGHGPGGGA
ncbi:MAG TPA: squalene--hopene cyclase [Streptosporangiaceae bacterium]|nr:squalene--hopene cyclase [Streptosporangiaceae bacterium]